jgi:hypothetical protein
MTFEPEMMIEEVGILLDTGRCPRCNTPLVFDAEEDKWTASCVACHTHWGGSF